MFWKAEISKWGWEVETGPKNQWTTLPGMAVEWMCQFIVWILPRLSQEPMMKSIEHWWITCICLGRISCFIFIWMLITLWWSWGELGFVFLNYTRFWTVIIILLWKGSNKLTLKSNILCRFVDFHPFFLTLIYLYVSFAYCTILAFHHGFSHID